MERIEKVMAASFGLAVVLTCGVSAMTLRSISLNTEASDWVNHTHAFILESREILSSAMTGETALRDFLITREQRALADARIAYSEAMEHLEVARALAQSHEANRRRIDEIGLMVSNRVDFARRVAAVGRSGNDKEIKELVSNSSSSEALAELKARLAELHEAQDVLIHERDSAAFVQDQSTRWRVVAGVGMNIAVLTMAGWLLRDDLKARRASASALALANQNLESRVQERTKELSLLNQTLVQENLERQWQAQALEHQLRYNNLILNSVDDIVLVTTRMLKVTRATQGTAQHLGLELSAIAGKSLDAFVVQPGQPGSSLSQQIMAKLKQGHEFPEADVVTFDAAQRPRKGLLRAFPLRDGDQIVGAVVVIRISKTDASKSSTSDIS